MITPTQCRAARGLLNLRADALAARAGISLPTLRTFEGGTRSTLPVSIRALHQELVAAGVVFLAADGEAGPGVRLLQAERP